MLIKHFFFILWLFLSYDIALRGSAQRAKLSEKVQKPSLGVNFINFELNVFNASIWVPWSPSAQKIRGDALIQI